MSGGEGGERRYGREVREVTAAPRTCSIRHSASWRHRCVRAWSSSPPTADSASIAATDAAIVAAFAVSSSTFSGSAASALYVGVVRRRI